MTSCDLTRTYFVAELDLMVVLAVRGRVVVLQMP
jgi:hypothetical protein